MWRKKTANILTFKLIQIVHKNQFLFHGKYISFP